MYLGTDQVRTFLNYPRSQDGRGTEVLWQQQNSCCQFSGFNERSDLSLTSVTFTTPCVTHLYASAQTKRRRANGKPRSSPTRQFVQVKTWRDSVMNTKLKAEHCRYSIAYLPPRETEDATRRSRRDNWKKEIFTPKLACLRKGFCSASVVSCEVNTSRTH